MIAAQAEAPSEAKMRPVRKIPPAFVYEMLDGKPVYYKGTHKAVRRNQPPESVMGTGRKQVYLIDLIVDFVKSIFNRKEMRVASNEVGIKFGDKSWVSSDIVLYRASEKKKMFVNEFFDFPPRAVIEVDTQAELIDFEDPMSYFVEKTSRLLDFGVEKVIWVFTKTQKVWVAEKGKNWETMGWEKTVEVLPGCDLNLLKLLEEDGTTLQEFTGMPDEKA